jgi:Immunity protein 49
MPPTYLPLAVKSAAMLISKMLPDIIGGRPTLESALYLSEMYRRMAVGFLLMSGTPDAYYTHLFRSGRSFAYFLEITDDARKATSKAAPFLDAIACNDIQGATLIAELSRRQWNPDKEYEDDFLYVDFLMQKFFLRADRTALGRILDRYEVVLDGAEDFRLDLCKALLAETQRPFDNAIAAFVDDASARLQRLRKADELNPDEAATTVHVSTELLAWLRLAGGIGFTLQRNYPMAPEPAMMFGRARLPTPDAWMTIVSFTDIL